MCCLCRQNMGALLEEVKTVQTEKEVELFLLQHGEQMVDCLGAEVDKNIVLSFFD